MLGTSVGIFWVMALWSWGVIAAERPSTLCRQYIDRLVIRAEANPESADLLVRYYSKVQKDAARGKLRMSDFLWQRISDAVTAKNHEFPQAPSIDLRLRFLRALSQPFLTDGFTIKSDRQVFDLLEDLIYDPATPDVVKREAERTVTRFAIENSFDSEALVGGQERLYLQGLLRSPFPRDSDEARTGFTESLMLFAKIVPSDADRDLLDKQFYLFLGNHGIAAVREAAFKTIIATLDLSIDPHPYRLMLWLQKLEVFKKSPRRLSDRFANHVDMILGRLRESLAFSLKRYHFLIAAIRSQTFKLTRAAYFQFVLGGLDFAVMDSSIADDIVQTIEQSPELRTFFAESRFSGYEAYFQGRAKWLADVGLEAEQKRVEAAARELIALRIILKICSMTTATQEVLDSFATDAPAPQRIVTVANARKVIVAYQTWAKKFGYQVQSNGIPDPRGSDIEPLIMETSWKSEDTSVAVHQDPYALPKFSPHLALEAINHRRKRIREMGQLYVTLFLRKLDEGSEDLAQRALIEDFKASIDH